MGAAPPKLLAVLTYNYNNPRLLAVTIHSIFGSLENICFMYLHPPILIGTVIFLPLLPTREYLGLSR